VDRVPWFKAMPLTPLPNLVVQKQLKLEGLNSQVRRPNPYAVFQLNQRLPYLPTQIAALPSDENRIISSKFEVNNDRSSKG